MMHLGLGGRVVSGGDGEKQMGRRERERGRWGGRDGEGERGRWGGGEGEMEKGRWGGGGGDGEGEGEMDAGDRVA